MDRRLTFRDLRRILKRYGILEVRGRGKGSERWFEGRVPTGYPITCHGEGKEVGVGLVKAVRRHFRLTPEHGVSDHDFYGG